MILVLVPLQLELSALTRSLEARLGTSREKTVGREAVRFFADDRIALGLGGHGKAQFALQSQHLIENLHELSGRTSGLASGLFGGRTSGLICAGAAGSLSTQLRLGDVVLASHTLEHDFKLRFVRRPQPRFPADANLLARFQAVSPQGFSVHTGVIASGDEDVISSSRRMELQTETSALAVAWEGSGGARAARYNALPFLEIRVITDSADSSAVQDFTATIKQGMENLAQLIEQVIAQAVC